MSTREKVFQVRAGAVALAVSALALAGCTGVADTAATSGSSGTDPEATTPVDDGSADATPTETEDEGFPSCEALVLPETLSSFIGPDAASIPDADDPATLVGGPGADAALSAVDSADDVRTCLYAAPNSDGPGVAVIVADIDEASGDQLRTDLDATGAFEEQDLEDGDLYRTNYEGSGLSAYTARQIIAFDDEGHLYIVDSSVESDKDDPSPLLQDAIATVNGDAPGGF